MPVTRHPSHSRGRAVFPHPVPRLYSFPRRFISAQPGVLRIEIHRFHYSPRGGWHMDVRSCCVRHVFMPGGSGGPPEFLGASFHTCHGLRTPPVLHILAVCRNVGSCLSSPFLTGFPSVPQYPRHIPPLTDALVLPSVHVKTLGDRNMLISELYRHFRERDLPCGLRDSLCTRSKGRSNEKLTQARQTRSAA